MGVGDAAEHGGNLAAAGLILHWMDGGEGAVVGDVLGDDEVMAGFGGYLWEMGDAQHLMVFAKSGKLLAHHLTGTAADADIHLVEDEGGYGIGGAEDGFQG